MGHVRWNLEEYLEAHDLTRYRLAQELPGNTNSWLTTLYRMSDPKRLDLATLAAIIATLRRLTDLDVTVSDLLSYENGDSTPPAGQEETPDPKSDTPLRKG